MMVSYFRLFCFARSPSRSIRSELPRVAAPLGPEEVTLPHSDPVPAAQVELAKPWIEVGHDNGTKKGYWKKFIGLKSRVMFLNKQLQCT